MARDEHICALQSDIIRREQLCLELSTLPHTAYAKEVLELLWGELPSQSPYIRVCQLIHIAVVATFGLAIGSVATGIGAYPVPLFLLMVFYLINIPIHYRTRAD